MLSVKVYSEAGASLPTKGTSGSAAMDVYSFLPPDTILRLHPGDRVCVPTGLYFRIPLGYFISVRPRSGLALNKGLVLPNAPATIDADYQGEFKILVANIDPDNSIQIENAQRIAQILLEKRLDFRLEETPMDTIQELKSERGVMGFGSTGLA